MKRIYDVYCILPVAGDRTSWQAARALVALFSSTSCHQCIVQPVAMTVPPVTHCSTTGTWFDQYQRWSHRYIARGTPCTTNLLFNYACTSRHENVERATLALDWGVRDLCLSVLSTVFSGIDSKGEKTKKIKN